MPEKTDIRDAESTDLSVCLIRTALPSAYQIRDLRRFDASEE